MQKLPKCRDAFSPSFLKKLMACQYSAIFDKFTEKPATRFGNVVHEIFALLYDPNGIKLNKDYFMKSIEFELVKGKLKDLDYKKFHDKAENINMYLQAGKFNPPEDFTVFDVETMYSFPKEYTEKIYNKNFFLVPIFENGKKMRGQIDITYTSKIKLEYPEILIRDWKTGSAENEPFQIVLYLLAIIRAFWINPDNAKLKGEYCYVETGEIVPVYFDEQEFLRTLDEVQRHIGLYYNAYKMNFFTKNPSFKACQWCSVDTCEHYRGK